MKKVQLSQFNETTSASNALGYTHINPEYGSGIIS